MLAVARFIYLMTAQCSDTSATPGVAVEEGMESVAGQELLTSDPDELR